MMSNELRSDWKDFAATAISFWYQVRLWFPNPCQFPGFQEDLVLSDYLAASSTSLSS